jgi:hypothetical protein
MTIVPYLIMPTIRPMVTPLADVPNDSGTELGAIQHWSANVADLRNASTGRATGWLHCLRPDVFDVLFVNAVEKRPRFFLADNLDLLKVVEKPVNL